MLSKEEIEKDTKRCKELIKVEYANWIGISNQLAITHILEYIEQQKTNKQKVIEKLGETRDNLERDGFVGYADEIQEILKIAKE